jgi:SAM-dependent methyltransferase
VVDVGCGTGFMTFSIARFVYPKGRVYGVDKSEEMLETARKNLADVKSALSLGDVEFCPGDALNLPFPDDFADATVCRAVLMHTADPQKALDEMVRVTKQGGKVGVMEPDYRLTIGYPPRYQEILAELWEKKQGRHPFIGLDLPSLFRKSGLLEIQIKVRFEPAVLYYPEQVESIIPESFIDQLFGTYANEIREIASQQCEELEKNQALCILPGVLVYCLGIKKRD